MQLDMLWFLIVILVMCVFFYFIIKGIRQNNQLSQKLGEIQYKHGLPITPRGMRQLSVAADHDVAEDEDDDALSNMAAAAVAAPVMHSQPEPVAERQAVLAKPMDESEPDTVQVPVQEVTYGFTQESPVLDQHLGECQLIEEEDNPLHEYEDTVTIVITPQYGAGVTGRQVLQIAQNYGLKYGSMNMFHRHESEDGRGVRWFSMMAEGKDGPTVFDLNTLPETNFVSLILFLVTPHKQPLRGYDSMVAIAKALAQDLNAILTDENRNVLTDEYFVGFREVYANQVR